MEILKRMLDELELDGFGKELWNRRRDGPTTGSLDFIGPRAERKWSDPARSVFQKIGQKTIKPNNRGTGILPTPLTGLPNRMLLEGGSRSRLRTPVAIKASSLCSFSTLDNFKQINDSLGHPFGDRVLN